MTEHPAGTAQEPHEPPETREATAPAQSSRDPRPQDGFRAFWREHHYSTLTTHRPDGTPHVVPVSVTYDPDDGSAPHGTARVVSRRTSRKVRNIKAAGSMRVALCQVDRGRWATLEGVARIREDAASVTDAEDRYETRYGRRPRPNPERVVIEIAVDRTMGRTPG